MNRCGGSNEESEEVEVRSLQEQLDDAKRLHRESEEALAREVNRITSPSDLYEL